MYLSYAFESEGRFHGSNSLGKIAMEKQKITWKKTGTWTLFTLFLSILAGIVLMGQRVVLAPPIASYTIYFYLAVVILPSLVVFVVFVRRRPEGPRVTLVLIPILASVMICFYFVLLGPAFYVDIQCQPKEKTGLIVRLDCQCEHAVSAGTAQAPCVAEQLWPMPLMRLVEENR